MMHIEPQEDKEYSFLKTFQAAKVLAHPLQAM